MTRRIGIFGGTFDPVHLGHLIQAEQCRVQGELDEVWFVPAARPPHKPDADLTPFDRRAEMLELATAGEPRFRVEPIEADRPGPSYTADTLAGLTERHPDAEFWLVIGADSLRDFATWREPARITELAGLLVAPRPGVGPVSAEALAAELGVAAVRLRAIDSPLIGLASHDIRARAAGGSVRYMVPAAVAVYIEQKGLYGTGSR